MTQTTATKNSINNKKGNRVIKSNLPFKQLSKIRKRARITPWCNPSEFDYVGLCLSHATLLFPNGDEESLDDSELTGTAIPLSDEQYNQLLYGIEKITHWRARATNGRLPHSVDISASIAEIILSDALSLSSESQSATSTVATNANVRKLSYASAIIRGVNGIADSIQKNRAAGGSSVAHLCSRIGLPNWIVDLRHDAAHNELPSLVPLRLAAKTLLGFLMEKYWSVLEGWRISWRDEGVALLVECKCQCKTLDRIKDKQVEMEMEVEQSQAQANEEGEEEDDGDEDSTEDGNFYGAYSIFMEASTKSKKKIKQASRAPKHSQLQSQSQPQPPQQKALSRTVRQCLTEFINNIPIDTGLPLITQYLIFGGIGDAPQGRGILIPGSPSLKENISSVRKIRERYSLILLTVASKWPGFVHMLFVNMVDLMISLDGSVGVVRSKENVTGTSHDGTVQDLDPDQEDVGKNRKLFFLKYWIQYLLSNEFYCFLQWHDVVWKGSKNMRERPRERWSEDLLLHMESSAPLDVLKRVRLPLNSACDRFSEGDSEIMMEMTVLLEGILGKERATVLVGQQSVVASVPLVGEIDARKTIKRPFEDISNDADTSIIYTDSKSESASSEIKIDVDNVSGQSKDENELEKNLIGLEELEEMLDDRAKSENGNTDSTSNVQIVVVDMEREIGKNKEEESRRIRNGSTKDVVPWTLCQHWEPCALGKLPGHA